jgi:hypothetical protein
MTQEFNMKEISSMDFPQHGEVFYFYGQALHKYVNIVGNAKVRKIKQSFRQTAIISFPCKLFYT